MSGTFSNTIVKNAPKAGLSVVNPGPLNILGVFVDDCPYAQEIMSDTFSHILIFSAEGNAPNSISGGKPAAHNTDGIDVDGSNLIIDNCCIRNQVRLAH